MSEMEKVRVLEVNSQMMIAEAFSTRYVIVVVDVRKFEDYVGGKYLVGIGYGRIGRFYFLGNLRGLHESYCVEKFDVHAFEFNTIMEVFKEARRSDVREFEVEVDRRTGEVTVIKENQEIDDEFWYDVSG